VSYCAFAAMCESMWTSRQDLANNAGIRLAVCKRFDDDDRPGHIGNVTHDGCIAKRLPIQSIDEYYSTSPCSTA
jgi:hypothetical protein